MLFPRRKARHIFNQAWRKAHPKKSSTSVNKASHQSTTYSVLLQYTISLEEIELLARVLSKQKLISYTDAMKALSTTPSVFRTRVSEERANQFKVAALEANVALTIKKN